MGWKGKLFLLSALTGALTGLSIAFYVLLTKSVSYLLFLGEPLKSIPKLPYL